MMRDKPIKPVLATLLSALPGDGVVICTQSANPRSLPAAELAAAARELAGAEVRVEAEARAAGCVGRGRQVAGRDGALVVTGSNYLLADLLREPGEPAGATL